MAKENYLERTCRQCGKKFMGFPRSFYCPECQEIRKKEQKQKYNDRKRAGGVVPLGSVIKCEICGKPIVKTSGRTRFCTDCAAKHLQRVDLYQSKKWNSENREAFLQAKRDHYKRKYYSAENQISSYPGVHYNRYNRKWRATIFIGGKQHYINCWSESEAIETRKKFEAIPEITENDVQRIREELRKSRKTF